MFGKEKDVAENAGDVVAEGTVMGNFQLGAQLPNGRTIQISGYLFYKESMESINERIDLLQAVTERQRVRCEIPVLEGARDQLLQAIKDSENALVSLEDRQLKGAKMTSQEKLNMNNLKTSIKSLQDRLPKAEAAVSEAKQKAGLEKAA